MKFGLIGPTYTAESTAAADEETINWYPETLETQGAQTRYVFFGTPGLSTFSSFASGPVRGSIDANGRIFSVSDAALYEVNSDGTFTNRGTVASDGKPVSLAYSQIQLFIVSAGRAYCYALATNTLTDVTNSLVGVPIKVKFADSYFVVLLRGNKFQVSDVLNGLVWPGIQVNAVSVFPEDITSIEVNHRELWVMGKYHIQPYQNTGSDNIFDVIPGALIEQGNISTFGSALADNSVLWISQDERGAKMAWRANGYTPQRISTHAVETAWAAYSDMASAVTYVYQDGGHLFWVIYVPSADCSWVYDVGENLWHKRAEWKDGVFGPHRSWNHVYAFNKHLVGDWNSGKLYAMSLDTLDDFGEPIRRLRRSPIIINEMEWVFHAELTLDFDTGEGPQPPLTDGDGNPRPPQCMLRWSDNRGKTWSNEHMLDCGFAGAYNTRVIQRRLGASRYRVYEVSVTDPIQWTLVDGYLKTA